MYVCICMYVCMYVYIYIYIYYTPALEGTNGSPKDRGRK